jgi:hypothetical protein
MELMLLNSFESPVLFLFLEKVIFKHIIVVVQVESLDPVATDILCGIAQGFASFFSCVLDHRR